MPDAIEITIAIAAPPETVWRCLTGNAAILDWWGLPVRLEPRPGGRFEERWPDARGRETVTAGRVLTCDAPTLLTLTWADEDWTVKTRVSIRLAARDHSTALTLRHSGWRQFGATDGDRLLAQHRAGWRKHLDDLKAYAEVRATD